MLPFLGGMAGRLITVGAGGGGGGGGSLDATIDTTVRNRNGTTAGADKTLTTGSVTVTPSGGAGGYTYAWVRISGDASIAINSPAAASTTFTATLAPDTSKSAVFQCTVTDAIGATVTKEVTVNFSLVYHDPYDGGTL